MKGKFKDIALTEHEFFYENGLKDGVALKERQFEFLKNTTLKQMARLKNQKIYQKLFRY
jgi:hypothetical protein